jgi:hypothetical protein
MSIVAQTLPAVHAPLMDLMTRRATPCTSWVA